MSANNHIIVGEPRRCLCGVYDGQPVGCQDIIDALDRQRAWSTFVMAPGKYFAITNNEFGPPEPTPEQQLLVARVIGTLVKDCS